jgi:hypothetical protein
VSTRGGDPRVVDSQLIVFFWPGLLLAVPTRKIQARQIVKRRSSRPGPLAHVTNELSGLISPEGQKLPPHQELSIRVLVKDQGVWRITAFHNTMLQR